jgi:hypothetical protein
MDALLENPLPIWIIGGLSVAILVSAFFKTASPRWLLAAGAALAVTAGLILLERTVVTEREVIENRLHELARALESDDQATILAAIAPEAIKVSTSAKASLKAFVIKTASIKNNLKIELQPEDAPRKAVATFNALLVGGDRGGITQEQRAPFFFTLHLVKQGDQWLIEDYKYEEFQEGL